MEVLSIISIGETIRHFGVFCEIRCNLRFLAIPDNPFKVMEGVVGLLHAAIQLLDAMESSQCKNLCVLSSSVKNSDFLWKGPPFWA